ncbi:MAG: peptidoglycan DD-metalloendopeptidase family protein [Alphaproteobacteria bacterium]|nr:peptidoglycan DD-metalloendopeptidase family protein [Alphaproteobacteria bacterium]
MYRAALPGLIGMVAMLLTPTATLGQDRGKLDKLNVEIQSQQERAEALGRKTKALAAELKTLRQQSIKLARETQDSESRLTALETQLGKTRDAVREREQRLALRNQQLGQTLSVLERLSRNPPRALLMSRGRPIDVVRQAMLLRTTLPAIQDRAHDLRDEIDVLAETRKELARQLVALQRVSRDINENRDKLGALIDRKAALLRRTKSERTRIDRRVKRLSREARSLKELFARLEAERAAAAAAASAAAAAAAAAATQESAIEDQPAVADKNEPKPIPNQASTEPQQQVAAAGLALPRPETLRPFPEGGSITLPARGDIDQYYGQNNRYGNTEKGITIRTRPAAQIVAPYDGKVVFAGPFRGYQHILIIEHTDGYHTLLAGMVRVDTAVGQWLLAGEPVGVMAKSKDGVPRLYFELRRRGQAVNPLPWFVEYRDKVRG